MQRFLTPSLTYLKHKIMMRSLLHSQLSVAAITYICLMTAMISSEAWGVSMYQSPILPSTSKSTEVEDSDAVYRQIWGQDPIKEFRLLPLSGTVDNPPKSGHWYPTSEGGLNRTDVLVRYDKAFNNAEQTKILKATNWESTYRTSPVEWHGHCNGYAASSLRHREPLYDVAVNTPQGEEIIFTRKDIKGLLTGVYMGVRYRFLGGERCEDNPKDALPPTRRKACDDINPGLFHVVITNWIGNRRQSIIFDRNADEQVWNFPVISFSSTSRPISPSKAMEAIGPPLLNYDKNPDTHKLIYVETTITYADAINNEEMLEHIEKTQSHYKYILELDKEGFIIGGEWAYDSITEHPDFLWIPLRPLYRGPDRANANPHLDIDTILSLWANSRGLDSPEDEPSPFDLLDTETGWGDYSFYTFKTRHLPSEFTFLSAILSMKFTQTLGYGRGKDLLSVFRDGRLLAKPYLIDGRTTHLPLPDSEAGITRYMLKWNMPFLPESERTKIFYTYAMD